MSKRTLLPLVVAALLLSACSDDADEAVKPAVESKAGSPVASSPGAPPGATSSPGAPAPVDLGEPVGSRRAGDGQWSLKAEIYPLKRSDRTVTANFRVTVVDGIETNAYQVNGLLSDHNTKSVDFSFYAADGVQLIDGVNAKAHLPASDGEGQCFCSRGLGGTSIKVGESKVFTAVYAAPPPDVRTMSVVVPTFGTFANVPLQ